MICDSMNSNKYIIYKKKTSPFVITFYKDDHEGKNYLLYKDLKCLEKEFSEVPILKFECERFKNLYALPKVPLPINLLIIERRYIN